jgi:hypothetical protein
MHRVGLAGAAQQPPVTRWESNADAAAAVAAFVIAATMAELATSQVRQSQLERKVNQLQVLAAEKDQRLADAAKTDMQQQQQLQLIRQQLQDTGGSHDGQ